MPSRLHYVIHLVALFTSASQTPLRRDINGPTVVWNAQVAVSTLDAFNAAFPVHGSRSWAIETALIKFLDVVEHNKDILAWCHRSVEKMLRDQEQRREQVRTINLRLNTDLYTRFNLVLPEWGATTWFIRRILEKAVAEADQSAINLENLMERVVSATTHDDTE